MSIESGVFEAFMRQKDTPTEKKEELEEIPKDIYDLFFRYMDHPESIEESTPEQILSVIGYITPIVYSMDKYDGEFGHIYGFFHELRSAGSKRRIL